MKTKFIEMTTELVKSLVDTNTLFGIEIDKNFFDLNKWFTKGPAWVFAMDNQIAFAIGFFWDENDERNVALPWMVPTSLFYKHKKTCFKAVAWIKEWVRLAYGVELFRTFVRDDNDKDINFVEHLGFVPTLIGTDKDGYTFIVYEEH